MPTLEKMKFIRYRGIIVNRHLYFDIINQIRPFMKLVMNEYDLSESELRYYNYFEYCEKILGYVIEGVDITGRLADYLAGSVMYESRQIVIGYNKKMIFGRQNFTKLHEITHAQIDINMNDTVKSQNFTDLIYRGYTSPEQFIEVRADICASYLLIPDPALKECIFKGYTFEELMDDFGISGPALKLRLKNYLVFNINLHPKYADHLINQFKNNREYLICLYMLYEN